MPGLGDKMTSITENGLKIREPDVYNVKKTTVLICMYMCICVQGHYAVSCSRIGLALHRLQSRHEDTRKVFVQSFSLFLLSIERAAMPF